VYLFFFFSEKLGVEPDEIRLAVEALVQLLVEGHRHKVYKIKTVMLYLCSDLMMLD